MDEETFKEKLNKGEVEQIKTEVPSEIKSLMPSEKNKIDDYIPFLEMLRKYKKHITTAPTHIPKTYLEQIQFYDDGVNFRVYLYVNGVWRYSSLT